MELQSVEVFVVHFRQTLLWLLLVILFVNCEDPVSQPSRSNTRDSESSDYVPSAVQNFVVTRSNSNVILSWTDYSEAEDGFLIKKRFGEEDWFDLAKQPANTNSFTDQSGELAVTTFYSVQAFSINESDTVYSQAAVKSVVIRLKVNSNLDWQNIITYSGDEVVDGVVLELSSDLIPTPIILEEILGNNGSSSPIDFGKYQGREFKIYITPFMELNSKRYFGELGIISKSFEIFELDDVHFRNTSDLEILFREYSSVEDSIIFTVSDTRRNIHFNDTYIPDNSLETGSFVFFMSWVGQLSRNYGVELEAQLYSEGSIIYTYNGYLDVDPESSYPEYEISHTDSHGNLFLEFSSLDPSNDILIYVTPVELGDEYQYGFSTRGIRDGRLLAKITGLNPSYTYRLLPVYYFSTNGYTREIRFTNDYLVVQDTLASIELNQAPIVIMKEAFHVRESNGDILFIAEDASLQTLDNGDKGGRLGLVDRSKKTVVFDQGNNSHYSQINVKDDELSSLVITINGDNEIHIKQIPSFNLIDRITQNELGRPMSSQHAINSELLNQANNILIQVAKSNDPYSSDILRYNYSDNSSSIIQSDARLVSSDSEGFVFSVSQSNSLSVMNRDLTKIGDYPIPSDPVFQIGRTIVYDSEYNQIMSGQAFSNLGESALSNGRDLAWSMILGLEKRIYSDNDGIIFQDGWLSPVTVFSYGQGFENRVFIIGEGPDGSVTTFTVNHDLGMQYFIELQQTGGWVSVW